MIHGFKVDEETNAGFPTSEGLYAAEVYFGWKLLHWRDGQWWHPEHTGRWTAGEPHQWVGPLPDRIGAKPAKPAQEFDL